MRLELEIIILIHHNSYYWEGGMNMDPAREQHQHARDAIRCSNSNWGSGVNFTPATLLSDQSWSLRGSNDRSSTDTLLVLNCWVCSALCRNLSHQIQRHTTIGCYATMRYYGFFSPSFPHGKKQDPARFAQHMVPVRIKTICLNFASD